jgi:NADPH:quinone reductase-like Zn-dependent oxidoreductase
MRALHIDSSVQPPKIALDSAAQPEAGPGELLIRVCAAGFMLTELSWDSALHTKTGALRAAAVPGHEFSGIVTALGEGVVSGLGDTVYGMNEWYSDGAMAEFCVAPVTGVATKPLRLTHVESASVPIGALTAWQGLFDHAKLQPGERVLIHGGAGSVGSFAIQLARLHGARATTTVSSHDRDYVASLGAEQIIDYRATRFEDRVQGMDVVFDTVGGDTLARSWSVLKPGGRMVTTISAAKASADPRVQKAFFIVEANKKQLSQIAGMLDARRLRTLVGSVIPLSEAPRAYAGELPKPSRGKLVVQVADSN